MSKIGDNSKLSEGEKMALLGYLVKNGYKAALERKQADDKAKENLAKAKEWGFDKQEVAAIIKMKIAGPDSSAVKRHGLMTRVLVKLGFIPDQAKDLFSDRVDRLQLLHTQGYLDGNTGEGGPGSSGYNVGTDEDNAYMDGWRAGQANFLKNWQIAMEKAQGASNKEEPPEDDPFADAAE